MRRLPILCAFVTVACGAFPVFASTGSDNCTEPGTRPALPSDAVVQNGQISVGTCYKPTDKDIGQNQEEAKKQLASMWCGGKPATCENTYVGSVEQIDSKFAQCAVRFLQAVRQKDPSICMTSAFRDAPHQACVCRHTSGPCASPGNSKHQKGVAIDIKQPGNDVLPEWIHAMARQGFGVAFPVRGDSGHMEPAGGRIQLASLGEGGGNAECSTPGYIAEGGGARMPSSYLSQALRDYLGGGQQGGALGDMGGGAGGNVPAGIQGFGGGASPYSAAQPAGGAGPGLSAQPYGSAIPAGGGSAGAVGGGAAGSIPAQTAVPAPIALSSGQDRNPVSTLLDENNVPQGNNAFNLIGSIAYPTTTATATAVAHTGAVPSPVVLNTATREQVTAVPAANAVPAGVETRGRVTLTAEPGASGVHTFPPAETGGSDATFGSQTALAQTLERIKRILLAIIDLLRPFRYVRPAAGGNEVEGIE